MLDKIENINPNSPYSGGNKPTQGSDKGFHKEFEQRMSFQDRIRFSPAAYYLTKINWQIKELLYKANEKVYIAFSASNFEFETETDFHTFYTERRQNFLITQLLETDEGQKKYSFRISVKKKIITLNEEADVNHLPYLNEMFKKALRLDITDYEYKPESVYIEELLTGLSVNLEKEFDYILSTLYTLLYKLKNFKLADNYRFEEDKEETIIIEKILMQFI